MDDKYLYFLVVIVATVYYYYLKPREDEKPKKVSYESEGFRHEPKIIEAKVTRTPSPNVIFLDIDGVLHPGTSGTFSYAGAFEEIMRKYPHVDIVLSSAWRKDDSLEDLQRNFSPDIAQRIVGTTPYIEDKTRFDEIQAFCSQYGIQKWVAVDDNKDLYPQNCSALIETHFYRGVKEPEVQQRLITALGSLS